MDTEEIAREAARAVEQLPKMFRRQLHNVTIVVEKKAAASRLRALGLDPKRDVLYGLYEGVPLSHRSHFNPPLLPDKITIFCEPLMQDFPDPDERRRQIHRTVIHEIAHYFGMDDDEIEDLGY
ncbi:MAG TPA: metallopeptidase family protein [Candidatus Binatia bacterium]|jgi:predicted Zn-dependent protease with MMP-like domain